jgi:hypothetical protein
VDKVVDKPPKPVEKLWINCPLFHSPKLSTKLSTGLSTDQYPLFHRFIHRENSILNENT